MQTVSFFIRFSWFKELMRIPEKKTLLMRLWLAYSNNQFKCLKRSLGEVNHRIIFGTRTGSHLCKRINFSRKFSVWIFSQKKLENENKMRGERILHRMLYFWLTLRKFHLKIPTRADIHQGYFLESF